MKHNPDVLKLIDTPYVRDDLIVKIVGASKTSIRNELKAKGARKFRYGWLSTDVIKVFNLESYIRMMVKLEAEMESVKK